jgi:hypothetical protein
VPITTDHLHGAGYGGHTDRLSLIFAAPVAQFAVSIVSPAGDGSSS